MSSTLEKFEAAKCLHCLLCRWQNGNIKTRWTDNARGLTHRSWPSFLLRRGRLFLSRILLTLFETTTPMKAATKARDPTTATVAATMTTLVWKLSVSSVGPILRYLAIPEVRCRAVRQRGLSLLSPSALKLKASLCKYKINRESSDSRVSNECTGNLCSGRWLCYPCKRPWWTKNNSQKRPNSRLRSQD